MAMKLRVSLWLLVAIGLRGAWAQTAFEVASVKQTPASQGRNTKISAPGELRFTASNVTLELLVELAFGVEDQYIVNAPAWMASERYDVVAKPEGTVGLSYVQLRPLLQRLLAERFKLETHRETKERQGFALQVANGGPKLSDSKGTGGQNVFLPNGLRGYNVPVAWLAAAVSRPAGYPVRDETGIPGNFDFKLSYAPEVKGDAPADSSLPSVFTALKEQLGLQLKPTKIAVETLVIDHVEKAPVEN